MIARLFSAAALTLLGSTVVFAQTPEALSPNRPSFGVNTITMNPANNGFYDANVMVNLRGFEGPVATAWLMVSAPHVKTPEDARQQIREKLERFADQIKQAAVTVNAPMR